MRKGGFTLVELMVVIAVMAILATVVIPSMQSVYHNGVNSSQANEFVTSLSFARNEAIKRGISAVICKSNDGSTCGGAGVNWQDGWLVCADLNNNGACDDGVGTMLGVHGKLSDAESKLVGTSGVANRVTFNANGGSQTGTFLLCDHRGMGEHAKAISISTTGRVRTYKVTDTSNPESVEKALSCGVCEFVAEKCP